jgi:large subunit ribosomal protein L15
MAIIDYLKTPQGANKKTKRRGRGQGSGHGKTACRGHKGQAARGNTKKYKGMEGGQMPLARRLPKRGFTNRYKRDYQLVDIKKLGIFSDGDIVNPEIMKKKGIISDAYLLVKVLGADKIDKKLEVHAHGFSQTVKGSIESAGGKAIVLKKPSPIKRKGLYTRITTEK